MSSVSSQCKKKIQSYIAHCVEPLLIVLTIMVSPKVLDYLDTQRIVPMVVDGKTTLLLIRPKAALVRFYKPNT